MPSRVYIGTSNARVIEDDLVPDLTKDAVLKAILLDQDIAPTLYDEISSGFGAKTQAAFNYAKDNYTYGLPTTVLNGVPTSYTLMPYVFFRSDDQNWTDPSKHNTAAYKTSVTYLKKLGIDYQEFGDSIHENDEIDQIEQAVLGWSIPLNTENQEELVYLFDFFDWLSTTVGAVDLTITELDYTNIISCDAVTGYSLDGNIGDIGTVTREPITTTETEEYTEYVNGDYHTVRSVTKVHLRFRKQLSATRFKEVRITNLASSYDIKGRIVTMDHTEDDLIIPMVKELVDNYPTLVRNSLYTRGLHLTLNSYVRVHLEFYETPLFSVFLLAAAIVATVYSLGSSAQGIGLALAAVGVTGAALVILTVLFTGIYYAATDYIFKLVAKELGAENTIILASILMVLGHNKNFGKDLTGVTLAAAPSNLALAGSNQMSADIAEIQKERKAFSEYAEEQYEALDEVNSELNSQTSLETLDTLINSIRIIKGESAQTLYNRTINLPNAGILIYDYIQDYVKMNLALPTIEETLQAMENRATT